MSYSAIVFNVLIASPSDVSHERNIIRDVIYEWNAVHSDKQQSVLLPVSWETHASPTMGDRPQAIINNQLSGCDLLVGVFWTRIGTSTGNYLSGSVEEIERHINMGKPVMLYFSGAPVHLDSVDSAQYSTLKYFKEKCRKRGICEEYIDLTEFRQKFSRQLQLKLYQDKSLLGDGRNISSQSGEVVEGLQPLPSLSKEAKILLKEASLDRHGVILNMDYIGGHNIQTNNKQMLADKNPRTLAMWAGAIDELANKGLINDKEGKGEYYVVTREGYEVAEVLNP